MSNLWMGGDRVEETGWDFRKEKDLNGAQAEKWNLTGKMGEESENRRGLGSLWLKESLWDVETRRGVLGGGGALERGICRWPWPSQPREKLLG